MYRIYKYKLVRNVFRRSFAIYFKPNKIYCNSTVVYLICFYVNLFRRDEVVPFKKNI